MAKTAAASNLFSTVSGEKRRGSGSPTTEGSRLVVLPRDLSVRYASTSPKRRGYQTHPVTTNQNIITSGYRLSDWESVKGRDSEA